MGSFPSYDINKTVWRAYKQAGILFSENRNYIYNQPCWRHWHRPHLPIRQQLRRPNLACREYEGENFPRYIHTYMHTYIDTAKNIKVNDKSNCELVGGVVSTDCGCWIVTTAGNTTESALMAPLYPGRSPATTRSCNYEAGRRDIQNSFQAFRNNMKYCRTRYVRSRLFGKSSSPYRRNAMILAAQSDPHVLFSWPRQVHFLRPTLLRGVKIIQLYIYAASTATR